MFIGSLVVSLHMPWVNSLKEKRMIKNSIISKISNKFNVSIAEIDEQDTHRVLVIGIVCLANEISQVDRILDKLIAFTETNTEANIVSIEREII
ncbi:MAG: DUF503 domain-containing protein [Epulopiscium sp.]|nr:DUF503 domain-containing protein [Candidatus Epulonipiscium sp.]